MKGSILAPKMLAPTAPPFKKSRRLNPFLDISNSPQILKIISGKWKCIALLENDEKSYSVFV
jgi:hypothetical protein